MSDVTGVWDLTIATPIGNLPVVLSLTDQAGVPHGTASSQGETVQLHDVTFDGPKVAWRQSVTTPIRLHLSFEVMIVGDTMTGHAKAGRLPRSTVRGSRRETAR